MLEPITLSQLSDQIKNTIADTFPFATPVVAEISEMNINRNRHCYIELIEQVDNKIVARLRGIIYANRLPMLQSYFSSVTGHELEVGLKVLIMVRLSFHPLYGLSVEINDIDPKYTLGDLEQQRRMILERLTNEGVIGMNRSLELPHKIKKIAIISSATAAGYGDFIKHLNTNNHGFQFQTDLYEAYMQGAQTVSSFETAINNIFNSNIEYDVIVIIRGGGSKAELAVFDNYEMAYLITQLPIPVLTGIGHERDSSVIDHVANLYFKTPTAVADFIVQFNNNAFDKLEQLQNRLEQSCLKIFKKEQERLLNLDAELKTAIYGHINQQQSQLVQLENRLSHASSNFSHRQLLEINQLKNQLQHKTELFFSKQYHRLERKKETLQHQATSQIRKKEQTLALYEHKIKLSDPQHILNLGYAIVTLHNKKIISSEMLQKNDPVKVFLKSGKFEANVTEID
ncbi:MAG: exodeoxyribonuclease VII large subunit [Salinivirgaceae bacterium]|nr:exodeoxyribonuclease VII large subunit [Salinivirgaceae bacterium]MDD4747276.1 exodeoxyribonuclease VII large subunit [Salinivirgaceae bacterium]MDY0279972.1 exodeoxyribonuclease VII large subunit [Salinivirgaceae bacterium]